MCIVYYSQIKKLLILKQKKIKGNRSYLLFMAQYNLFFILYHVEVSLTILSFIVYVGEKLEQFTYLQHSITS